MASQKSSTLDWPSGSRRPLRHEATKGTLTAGSIHICPANGGGRLEVVAGGDVRCGGDFSFDMVEELDMVWEPGTTLTMTGGVGLPDGDPTNYPTLEVGGLDSGVNPVLYTGAPVGFTDNFHLEELVIGAGAHVKLVDLFDNGHRCVGPCPYGTREALYVRALTFEEPAGRLHLGGLHLYYDPALSSLNAASRLTGFRSGDGNCDGNVDFFDIDPFLIALFNPAVFASQYPNCDRFAADTNANGLIDFFDIDPFIACLFGGCP